VIYSLDNCVADPNPLQQDADGDKVGDACDSTPAGFCGDGIVPASGAEECDDGNTVFVQGQYCDADCLRVPCGRPTDSPGPAPLASDALLALRAAVGAVACDLRVCDTDASKLITAGDALLILRASVGQAVTFNCPLSRSRERALQRKDRVRSVRYAHCSCEKAGPVSR